MINKLHLCEFFTHAFTYAGYHSPQYGTVNRVLFVRSLSYFLARVTCLTKSILSYFACQKIAYVVRWCDLHMYFFKLDCDYPTLICYKNLIEKFVYHCVKSRNGKFVLRIEDTDQSRYFWKYVSDIDFAIDIITKILVQKL